MGLVWAAWITRLWLLWQANQLPAFDFGIFAQVTWGLAHGEPGRSSLLNNTHWLGDHFQPILYLYAPILRACGTPFALIVGETALVAAAARPLARITFRATGSPAVAFTLALAYLVNPATTAAVMFPVHPSTLVAPLLIFAFDAFDTRHPRRAAGLTLLALCCKEDVGFYLAGLGIWLALARRERAVGLSLAVFGAAWSLACIFAVIPWFRGAAFHMFEWAPALRDGGWANPVAVLRTAVDSPEKLRLLLLGFGALGFLPLGDPLTLAAAPFLAERLLGSNPNHVDAAFHYGAPSLAVLTVAAALAAARLGRRFPGPWTARGIGGVLILGTAGACAAAWSPGVPTTDLLGASARADARAVQEALALVPAGASVLAQDTLVARFADHRRLGVIARRPVRDWDYVVADVTLPDAAGGLPGTLHAITSTSSHGLIYSAAGVAVWQRRAIPRATLSPEVAGYLAGH